MPHSLWEAALGASATGLNASSESMAASHAAFPKVSRNEMAISGKVTDAKV